MRRIALAAAVTLAMVGCSSDDDAVSEPTEEALAATAQEATQALFEGPADSYEYLSERCQEEWARGDWGANVTMGMGMVLGFAGIDKDEAVVGEPVITEFSETEAMVELPLLDQDGEVLFEDDGDGSPWVFEDGWKNDSCEKFGE